MKIKMVDSLKYVASHPEIFINEGADLFHELASRIVSDVISFDCLPVAVDFCLDWWVVSSPKNWLDVDRPVSELFTNLIPNPKAGRNASRNEIVVNAFADNVIVCQQGHVELIKGKVDEALINEIKSKYPNMYLIAFN